MLGYLQLRGEGRVDEEQINEEEGRQPGLLGIVASQNLVSPGCYAGFPVGQMLRCDVSPSHQFSQSLGAPRKVTLLPLNEVFQGLRLQGLVDWSPVFEALHQMLPQPHGDARFRVLVGHGDGRGVEDAGGGEPG